MASRRKPPSKQDVVLSIGREVDGKAKQAGEVVSVDEQTAHTLIRDGHARPADKKEQ